MFPDQTSRWLPYPSVIDGIEPPPSVIHKGFRDGVLSLVVMGRQPCQRAYGVRFACEAFGVVEETLYSIRGHGDEGLSYGGGVYMKQAAASALRSAYDSTGPYTGQEARHFALVGADYCFEVLATGEPYIVAFDDDEQARMWGL